MKQQMRFGSKAPGGGPVLTTVRDHAVTRVTAPRIVIGI